jgi:N-hydroxyarylamine O-acetyltransferase
LYDISGIKRGAIAVAEFFDDAEYRRRVNHTADISVTETSLESIHRAQVFKLPFENFNIHLGRGINVSPEAIYNKVVKQPRGGYCFELNGLLLQALTHYGFDARALLARVHVTGVPGGRTHQITLINLNGQHWIADVGFGAASLHSPIPFETDRVDKQDGQEYRITEVEPWGYMLQLKVKDDWMNLYSFDLNHVCHGDIETGNHYTSTSPDVHFTQVKIASQINPSGRVSLSDYTLTRVVSGESTQTEVPAGEGYVQSLELLFGIQLDASFEDFKS